MVFALNQSENVIVQVPTLQSFSPVFIEVRISPLLIFPKGFFYPVAFVSPQRPDPQGPGGAGYSPAWGRHVHAWGHPEGELPTVAQLALSATPPRPAHQAYRAGQGHVPHSDRSLLNVIKFHVSVPG